MARLNFTNTKRWREVMGRSGFSAVLVTSPNAIFYTTGALLPAQLKASPSFAARLLEDRSAFALIPADGEPILVVSSRDFPLVSAETWARRVESYEEVSGEAIEVVRAIIAELHLEADQIGIEAAYTTAADLRALRAALPSVRFIPCDAELNLVRAVKTPFELEILQNAGEITAEAIWSGFQSSREGDTEKDLADRIAAALFDLGADDIYLAVLGAGENTFHAHNRPGQRRLDRGDLVRTDFGGKFDGFASDLARMGVVGEPTRAQADMYRMCREVQLATIETIRPGVEARSVYANCSRLFSERGFQLKFPHVGHAFALGGHDYPMFYPGDKTPIEVGMLFYVEPLMDHPDIGLIQIEDLVHVTADGPKILTGSRDNNSLWSIPI